MPRTKKTPPVEPLTVVTVKLTPAEEQTLHRVSQEATDRLGWTVSRSAVIRALIHYMQQTPAWATSALHPLIKERPSPLQQGAA